MSKRYLENILKKELAELNELIDAKIVMGMPYMKEAREHKFLFARLVNAQKAEKNSWFKKFNKFSFASAFLL